MCTAASGIINVYVYKNNGDWCIKYSSISTQWRDQHLVEHYVSDSSSIETLPQHYCWNIASFLLCQETVSVLLVTNNTGSGTTCQHQHNLGRVHTVNLTRLALCSRTVRTLLAVYALVPLCRVRSDHLSMCSQSRASIGGGRGGRVPPLFSVGGIVA